MQLENILKGKFHFSTFRKGQKEIIKDIINDQNVVALLPTGAGKSICYQLPGYVLDGAVLIVSPLLSLMEDQVQQLKSRGEKQVVGLNSILSYPKRKQVLQSLHHYRFIYASPEILQSPEVMQALQSIKISLFVIDEAHCISQWGHEFRTDYLKLSQVKKSIGNPPCLALTATATKPVVDDIINQLQLANVKKHIYSIDRPNIAMAVKQIASLEEKIQETIDYVKTLQGPGIIYFSSRAWTEEMTRLLRQSGIERVAYYHGGLENNDRLLIQQQFIYDQLDVICCTNAFGMGVDKANVRFVIHFHYPSQMESYLQEIGRAGRDGEPSIAILLYCKDDHDLAKNMILHDLPTKQEWDLAFQLFANCMDEQTSNDLVKLLMETYGVSEVKTRFIKYQLESKKMYINGKVNPNICPEHVKIKIMELVEERATLKQRNLANFRRWIIENNHCRRADLLRTFDQKIEIIPIQCCDYCGLEIQQYKKGLKEIGLLEYNNWENELKLIFKQSGEG